VQGEAGTWLVVGDNAFTLMGTFRVAYNCPPASTSTNPRSHDTITEIRELDRSEPDATLFEIPTDYKIVK
jgi:hypothetical protein